METESIEMKVSWYEKEGKKIIDEEGMLEEFKHKLDEQKRKWKDL